MNLIDLVFACEERCFGENLEENAADGPNIHFIPIEAVSKQALWRPVPTCRDVLGVRHLGVHPLTRPEISEFNSVIFKENIFGLDIPMEDALAVHVLDRLQQRVDVLLHLGLGNEVRLRLGRIQQVHFHQFENKCKSASRLVVQDFVQVDNVRVRHKVLKGQYFSAVINLVDRCEEVFHAFYSVELSSPDALRFKNLRVGALSFFRNESVLYTSLVN